MSIDEWNDIRQNIRASSAWGKIKRIKYPKPGEIEIETTGISIEELKKLAFKDRVLGLTP